MSTSPVSSLDNKKGGLYKSLRSNRLYEEGPVAPLCEEPPGPGTPAPGHLGARRRRWISPVCGVRWRATKMAAAWTATMPGCRSMRRAAGGRRAGRPRTSTCPNGSAGRTRGTSRWKRPRRSFGSGRTSTTRRRTLVALHGRLSMREQETTIWMDGRPRPPDYALHTWSGFSTGEWDGDTLVQTATHLKEAYIRRWGPMRSDQATVRIRWKRIGDLSAIDRHHLRPGLPGSSVHPDVAVLGAGSRPRDASVSVRRGDRNRGRARHRAALPAWQEPAARRRIRTVTDRFGTPYEARLGGAETMYPEYIAKMRAFPRPAGTAPGRTRGASAMSRRRHVALAPSQPSW